MSTTRSRAGQLGNRALTLVNSGTIDATGGNAVGDFRCRLYPHIAARPVAELCRTVTGFSSNGSNFLDLPVSSFGAGTKATYSGTASGETLKVTDGTHTASIALVGD
jgi:hypothetical protein